MGEKQPSVAPHIQYFDEATFSLNLAFLAMAFLFMSAPYTVIAYLNRVEFSINNLLRIRQTDLILGYWEFFLPAVVLTLCIWMPLRLSSHNRWTSEILRSVGGVTAVVGPPVYWLCGTYAANRRYGWNPLHTIQLYEVLLVLIWLSLCLRGTWPLRAWMILILFIHYGFWFWQFWPSLLTFFRGYGGSPSVTSIVGAGASMMWMFYMLHLEREPTANSSR